MGIFKLFGRKNKETTLKSSEHEHIGVSQNVRLIPYFIYSNTENRIIGSIYLSEDQAYILNQFMKYKGPENQDIVFLME